MKKNSRSVQGESYLIVVRRFSYAEFLLTAAYFAILIFFLPLQYDNIKARTFLYPVIWWRGAGILFNSLFFDRAASFLQLDQPWNIVCQQKRPIRHNYH